MPRIRCRPGAQVGDSGGVKLLFDEKLLLRLVDALRDVYPESQHVSGVGGQPASARSPR